MPFQNCGQMTDFRFGSFQFRRKSKGKNKTKQNKTKNKTKQTKHTFLKLFSMKFGSYWEIIST